MREPLVNLPGASPETSVGKLFNFISRACPPNSSRGDSKEKANRGLMQPFTGLACPFPPAASSGVPWLFPMADEKTLLRCWILPLPIGIEGLLAERVFLEVKIFAWLMGNTTPFTQSTVSIKQEASEENVLVSDRSHWIDFDPSCS